MMTTPTAQPPRIPTVVVHLTCEGVMEAICADAHVRVILVDYTLSESETAVMGPDGDKAVMKATSVLPDPERVVGFARAAGLPDEAVVSSLRLEMLDERNDVAGQLAPLGFGFIGGGTGFDGWDMELDYSGWEVFVNGDGTEYTLTVFPAGRMDSDNPTFHHTCTTREQLIEELTQLRVHLDRTAPLRHLMILRDNGRIDQLLCDTPGLNVTLLDIGTDRHHDGLPLITLRSGLTGQPASLPVHLDADQTARLLHSVHDGSDVVPGMPSGATSPMQVILIRDNGRFEQVLCDTPGLSVTLLDLGKDRHDTAGPFITLPSGDTALAEILRVDVFVEQAAEILQAVAANVRPVNCMLVVWDALGAHYVVTAEQSTHSNHPLMPGRKIVQHLMAGGSVDLIAMTVACEAGDLLALQNVLRGTQSMDSLASHITTLATYRTLDEFLRDES
ncbi:hypothetical protein [Deinococcus ruber]|uniref:Uncharacterized protein n=1 Tax=Deinococcus ruber TaxID=1848197 RepID=A0A918F7U6_9DEIO|nr:hypothetical protein [Deinococcus ruber]GGR17157.1 hypothetical protein GCM10008957_32200 [Deinococcus ruber]